MVRRGAEVLRRGGVEGWCGVVLRVEVLPLYPVESLPHYSLATDSLRHHECPLPGPPLQPYLNRSSLNSDRSSAGGGEMLSCRRYSTHRSTALRLTAQGGRHDDSRNPRTLHRLRLRDRPRAVPRFGGGSMNRNAAAQHTVTVTLYTPTGDRYRHCGVRADAMFPVLDDLAQLACEYIDCERQADHFAIRMGRLMDFIAEGYSTIGVAGHGLRVVAEVEA